MDSSTIFEKLTNTLAIFMKTLNEINKNINNDEIEDIIIYIDNKNFEIHYFPPKDEYVVHHVKADLFVMTVK